MINLDTWTCLATNVHWRATCNVLGLATKVSSYFYFRLNDPFLILVECLTTLEIGKTDIHAMEIALSYIKK